MNDRNARLLVHAGTLAVLDESGDLTGTPIGTVPSGLFRRDARHLSRWQLTLDGAPPEVLTAGGPAGTTGPPASTAGTVSVLTPRGSRAAPPGCTVFREQAVSAAGLTERLRLTGNTGAPATVRVELAVDADFADLFALRRDDNAYDTGGFEQYSSGLPDGVEFGRRRGAWHSRTAVTADPPPEGVSTSEPGSGQRRLSWTVDVPPHGSAELRLRVTAHPHGAPPPGPPPDAVASGTAPDSAGGGDPAPVQAAVQAAATRAFVTGAPRPGDRTSWAALVRACEQGLADLDALRIPAHGPDGETVHPPAAGVPWFLTLFGRDALLTSLFALPYRPEPAAATLLALAATQATAVEPERVAQPGKIVHEIRHGELAHFGQVPFARYYGTVDGTPLFLVLLGTFTEQTGDPDLARRLEPQARAAVEWMFRYGGLDERGYLVYEADAHGLANQNWKDSPDGICFADGTPATGAVAAAEVQGYAWDALRRTARLAREVWSDPDWARRLEEAADGLRTRFRRDFWMPEQGFPALALDGDGRQADALASDAGHLLWSGILDPADAAAVGRRLLEPDFFSGWGIRTLAAGQGAYDPLSYHRGSVWPHDNAVIALGLARYGLREEARTLAGGLVAAAEALSWRLPEVLGGHGSDEHHGPVPYPHSCSPQAWAAAAPLALLTAVGDAPGT